MGRVPTGQRKCHLRHLSPLHYSILELVALGFDNKRIVKTLGVSRNTVSDVKNSDIAQPVLAQMDSILQRANREVRLAGKPIGTLPELGEAVAGALKTVRYWEELGLS